MSDAARAGMSFWTDAAVLGGGGHPVGTVRARRRRASQHRRIRTSCAMFSRAGTCWQRWPLPGAGQPRWTGSPAGVATRSSCAIRATLVRSGGFPELDQTPLGAELMPLGITVEPAPWTAPAHFPPRRVVPTRGAPHHHPRPSKWSTESWPLSPHNVWLNRLATRDIMPSSAAGAAVFRCRKLFGVVGHHGTHLLIFLVVGRRRPILAFPTGSAWVGYSIDMPRRANCGPMSCSVNELRGG